MSRFRVLQFNMQYGQGWDETDPDHVPFNLDATMAEIRQHDADIILLQEVEHAQEGGHQFQPPPNYTRLQAELPGYDSWFAYPKEDPRELPFGIGQAIFSRTPLSDRMRVDLPSPPITFDFFGKQMTPTDRLLIGARTVIDGHSLQIYNTHLLAFFMLGTSSETNLEQRDIVTGILQKASGPAIIGGDFNTRDHDSLAQQFAGAGFGTAQKSEITWRRMPYVLDHVFFNQPLHCIGHQVCPTMASDHHALVVDLEFAD